MIDISKVDYEKLRNPHPMFKLFSIKEEDPNTVEYHLEVNRLKKKVASFKKMLMEKELWISDEYRSEGAIDMILASYFSGLQFSAIYEAGDFKGIVGITDVYPEFKASVMFKIWDKSLWGKEFVRAGRQLLDLYTDEFKLKRMSTETADPQIVRLAEMFGFKVDGEKPLDFSWDGKFYTRYLLGRYGE